MPRLAAAAAVINSLDGASTEGRRKGEREFSSSEEEEEEEEREEPSLNQRKVHVSHPCSENSDAMR